MKKAIESPTPIWQLHAREYTGDVPLHCTIHHQFRDGGTWDCKAKPRGEGMRRRYYCEHWFRVPVLKDMPVQTKNPDGNKIKEDNDL